MTHPPGWTQNNIYRPAGLTCVGKGQRLWFNHKKETGQKWSPKRKPLLSKKRTEARLKAACLWSGSWAHGSWASLVRTLITLFQRVSMLNMNIQRWNTVNMTENKEKQETSASVMSQKYKIWKWRESCLKNISPSQWRVELLMTVWKLSSFPKLWCSGENNPDQRQR